MPTAPAAFQTLRLRGERIGEQHFAELRLLDADAGVQAGLFGDTPSEADTRLRLERRVTLWAEHGMGEYVVRLLGGPFVGAASLFPSHAGGEATVEVGYMVRSEHWNRGYATEMTEAMLRIAFESLRLPHVYAATDPANAASRRVMEKCGLAYVRDFLYRGTWPSVLYRLERGAWLRRAASRQCAQPGNG